MNVVELRNVTKRFDEFVAVKDLSFEVKQGSVFGLLGPNGAGKTTSIRMIVNIFAPDTGEVVVLGEHVTTELQQRIGYLPEERGLYLRMKVIDVLRFFAALYGVPEVEATAEVEDWLERFRVPEYRDRKVEELSKGNQQKIQFIAAILHDPQVLIMDEPFSGLDPVNVQLLKEAFLEMRDRGKTLIFSTHQMEQVEELCEAIAIIDRGRVVESGPLREVKRRMGRQVVRLAVEQTDGAAAGARPAIDAERGNGPGWIQEIPGVTLTRRGQDYLEMHVASGTDPESILQAALARGERVIRFEIADPSLEEIFIERVGHRAIEEERHLAGGRHDPDEAATEPAPEEVTAP